MLTSARLRPPPLLSATVSILKPPPPRLLTSYVNAPFPNILGYVVLELESCKINDIWFNQILKIIFEVKIEFYSCTMKIANCSVAENHCTTYWAFTYDVSSRGGGGFEMLTGGGGRGSKPCWRQQKYLNFGKNWFKSSVRLLP